MANLLTSEEQVKSILGINTWRELSKEKFLEYLKLSPRIDKDLHMKILDQVPNFVSLSNNIATSIVELAQKDKEVSLKTLDILHSIANALTDLSKKEFLTTEERMYVLDKLIEIAHIVSKIEERNKGFILTLAKVVAGIGTFALLVLAIAFGVQQNQEIS